MLSVLAPGQGSQKPGFLTPWLTLPGVEARLRWWSTFAGVDLVHLGTTADADEIRDTARTQPLLVAAALIAAEQLTLDDTTVIAGHSVGELGAAALAGVLSAESAVALAAIRGREMAAACALEPTGMSAVLGGDPAEVLAALETAGLYPANNNGAGQVVAAGSQPALDAFASQPPSRTRVIPLKVAGAFHTPYMAPAEKTMASAAAGISTGTPTRILLSNRDGSAVDDGQAMLTRLVQQVTTPVRWDRCMATLRDLGVTAVIELPPAGTLAGLVKRACKGIEIVTVNTPDDLAAARDLVARHGSCPVHEPQPEFRTAVTSVAGTFRRASGLAQGDPIRNGQTLGQVDTRQGPVEITAHGGGLLTEWLVSADDPVSPGQPIARLGGQE